MTMELVLGIDIGTTSVKVALVDKDTTNVIRTKSRETHANMHSELGSIGNEQDPNKIVTALQICVSGLPKDELLKVSQIGICGQMHGVLLWKRGGGWTQNAMGRYDVGEASQLFTWQDGRCTPEFMDTLPTPDSHLRIASGMGVVTTFWLQRHNPDLLKQYDCAGTIQDYVVAMLCGLADPAMSVHNAASWGYFNSPSEQWNTRILEEAGFPIHLLPRVCQAGSFAGLTTSPWYGIPEGTPVGAALGDLQCAFYSGLPAKTDAVLNISTSAQLAFKMNSDFSPPVFDPSATVDYFPYFKGAYLAVAASLTGGNVLHGFVKLLQQWTHQLGLGVPSSKIWEKVNSLTEEAEDTDLIISPTIFGERHNASERGSVTNITSRNTSLGSVYTSLSRGIITNLHSMMPQQFLRSAGVQRIVGSGTAVIKNAILRREIEAQFELPLVLAQGSEADSAVGAALAIIDEKPA